MNLNAWKRPSAQHSATLPGSPKCAWLTPASRQTWARLLAPFLCIIRPWGKAWICFTLNIQCFTAPFFPPPIWHHTVWQSQTRGINRLQEVVTWHSCTPFVQQVYSQSSCWKEEKPQMKKLKVELSCVLDLNVQHWSLHSSVGGKTRECCLKSLKIVVSLGDH